MTMIFKNEIFIQDNNKQSLIMFNIMMNHAAVILVLSSALH